MTRPLPPESGAEPSLSPLVQIDDDEISDKSSGVASEVARTPTSRRDEPVVTRKELWSYYLYYNGDNGVGPLSYSMTLFQSLANAAGFDPVKGLGSDCSAPDASGQCVVPWAGGTKSVNSAVLVANGASFAVMTLLFTTVGSVADYGSFGRWLLLVVTVLCWGAQFASMSLTRPDRWGLAMALYMVGFITYGATLVFYAAIFPRLARNTAHARQLKEKFERGEISAREYDLEVSMETNRISNISTISTKKMFAVTNVATILIPLWGMIGIWTTKFGFHNVWEFWAYNVISGLFQAPYYAFSQTMMAELTPPGFDNMFFGLFGLSNRASSLIGPNVVQAIIDKSGNNWKGFPFLFALCTAACLVIWLCVDVPTGRREAAVWAEKHRSYAQMGVLSAAVETDQDTTHAQGLQKS
ncbi:vacuole effluxer Atg22 like-domain-containing protein [Trametes meyenii]|nr:vacuole effluxer Atg22 like-domain-containing protein [Trametes meyenii]